MSTSPASSVTFTLLPSRTIGMRSAKALGGHLITKNKVEGQMAIWTRKNGMAVNNYLAVKKPVRP